MFKFFKLNKPTPLYRRYCALFGLNELTPRVEICNGCCEEFLLKDISPLGHSSSGMCKRCIHFVRIKISQNPWLIEGGPQQVFEIIDFYRGNTQKGYGYLDFKHDFDKALYILKRRLSYAK